MTPTDSKSRFRRGHKPPDPNAPLRTETELTGQVVRIVYASEDGNFQIVRFQAEDEDDMVTLSGNLPGVAAGEPLQVNGEWKFHRQHGPTFEVATYVPILPKNTEMLEVYLGSGLVKGIGPAYAKRIVKKFGEGTLDILDHAPERLCEVSGLGRKKAQEVSKAWEEHRKMHEVMYVLSQYGLTPNLTKRLLKHYGNEAAAILRTNPYRAGIEMPGVGFTTADMLAEKAGIPRDSDHRVIAGLFHLLSQAADEGHTFVARELLLERGTELLGLPAEVVTRAFDHEAARQKTFRVVDLPTGVTAVFMGNLYRAESGVARCVSTLMSNSRKLVKGDVTLLLDAFEAKFRFTLAPLQRDAIQMAVRGGVVVVTGGPGTGKTTLVRAMLHVLDEAAKGRKVALCSPTGRASQRLSETTRRPAMTIHRLLKYNPQKHGFTHGPEEPLDVDMLIVDEASMLDVSLAHSLVRAVKPGTTVVFVGDVDQLPSVGPGNVLRDLIESGLVPTVELSVVFRQAGESLIVQNAHRINEGKLPVPPPKESKRDPDFYFIERENPSAITETALEMITRRIPSRFKFDPRDDVQVLVPMRRGDLGTNQLNTLLQDRLNSGASEILLGGNRLRVGDKVIQNSNNYDLEVFNGDVGRITMISRETQSLRVVFGKRSVEYRLEEADQLSLAYAVTIHKSQGSEYPAVVVLLHTQQYIMLRRNLLYTAVTRGKKLVVVIGTRRALAMAIGNASAGDRNSALIHWLARPPEKEGLLE